MSDTVFNKPPITGLTPIDSTVKDQLKVRSELHGKKYSDPDFTQHYINSNYGFVRLSSGISIDSLPDAPKKLQLLGGTLNDGSPRRGINFEGKGLLKDEKTFEDNNNLYTFEKEGIVPLPGITSFDMTTMGEEGLLRQVNINIECHSVEHFGIMEKLYMRPGFQILVEWGHSVYIDQQGNKVYSPKVIDDSIIFADQVDMNELRKEGGQLIFDSQHNYDYVIATIRNYSWSYDRGVYTIEIEAMGTGGLSATQARMFRVGVEKDSLPDAEADKELEFDSADKLEGSFTTIMKTISESAGRGRQSEDPIKPIQVDQGKIDSALKKRKVDEYVTNICSEIGNGFKLEVYKLDFLSNKTKKKFTYIPFRFIFGCFNHFFLPKLKGEKTPEGKFCTEDGRNLYLTYDNHYSVDPYVCLLPKQSASTPLDTSPLNGRRDKFEGELLDVWINTGHVYDVIQAVVKDEKATPTVATFLDALLQSMRTAMGGINDFALNNDYYLDFELGPTTVIDREIPTDPSVKEQEFVIQSLGKNSYVENMSFNTSIDQATLDAMTIQAVLSGTDAAKSVHRGVSAYSIGLKDRFNKTDEGKTTIDDTAKPEDQKKSVEETYSDIYTKKVYNSKTIDSVKYAASDAQQIELSDKLYGEGKHTGFAIPGDISLVMKGIGGIKIKQFFRLPYDNLPKSYKESDVVFLVSNISHQIDGGKWLTDINAKVYIV